MTAPNLMWALLAAAALARAGGDTIDPAVCASDTQVVYNYSGVSQLAEEFFDQIGIAIQSESTGPGSTGPGFNHTIIAGGTPLGNFQSAYSQFQSGCEIVRAGWCGSVNFSATWITPNRAKIELGFMTAICIPLSCCSTSGCSLDYGIRQVASAALVDMVYGWCNPPINGTGPNCPTSVDSLKLAIDDQPWVLDGALGDASKRATFWLATPEQRASLPLPDQPAGRKALMATPEERVRAWLGPGGSGRRTLRSPPGALSAAERCGVGAAAMAVATPGNGTSLQTSVTTTCVSGGLDIFAYLLVSLSLVMLVCVGIACGQRCYYARRVRHGLDDLPGMFADGYEREDEDAEVRAARVAHRQQALRNLAFAMGSRELHGKASSGSAALTTIGGPSGARKDSLSSAAARGNPDAAASLLSGPEEDAAGPGSLLASLTADSSDDKAGGAAEGAGGGPTIVARAGEGDEHVDPITLDTISPGEQVVEFPGCNHLFRLDSMMQWFETNETCPVCRRPFSAPATPPAQSAAATADAGGAPSA